MWLHGRAFSKAELAAITSLSAPRRPMICIPTGTLSHSPAGAEAAGWPVKFVKKVMHHPIRGSTSTPLILVGPLVSPVSSFRTGMHASVGDTMTSWSLNTPWIASKTWERVELSSK